MEVLVISVILIIAVLFNQKETFGEILEGAVWN